MEHSASEFKLGGLSPYLSCDWEGAGLSKDGKVFSREDLDEFQKFMEEIELAHLKEFEKIRDNTKFGHEMRQKCFSLGTEINYLNHGSYGATLRSVMEVRIEWMKKQEISPWPFLEMFVIFANRRAAHLLSKFVNCDMNDLVLVPNSTTAMSDVLRSIPLKSEETILITNFTYAAIKKAVHLLCQERGAKILTIDITEVLDKPTEMLALFERTIKSNTRYVVIDHIISETGTILPIKEIIELCHRKGIKCIVDGAHSLGSIEIDLKDLNPDYYCSNGHKWLCSAKGCAFLYVKDEHQKALNPGVISHGYPFSYLAKFVWTGTDDYSAYLSMPVALSFFDIIGSKKIMSYGHDMVITAAKRCAEAWKTSTLCKEEAYAMMCTVELPAFKFPTQSDTALKVRNYLWESKKIVVPIIPIAGKMYARLSAHVYTEIQDYQILIDSVNDMAKLVDYPWK